MNGQIVGVGEPGYNELESGVEEYDETRMKVIGDITGWKSSAEHWEINWLLVFSFLIFIKLVSLHVIRKVQ